MIKKLTILSMLVVFAAASSAFAWGESFRSISTGNLLYGDFDNDLDPIYIFDNEGYRIYSTLSNLSNADDQVFDNDGDGVYLFGVSGTFGLPVKFPWESRTMFLIQLADNTTYGNTGFDWDFNGAVDENTLGDVSADRVNYDFWNPGLGTYSTLVNNSQTADNFDILKRRDWHLTHSYTNGDKKIGFAVSHLGYGDNYDEDNRHRGQLIYLPVDNQFSYTKNRTYTDLTVSPAVKTLEETRAGDFSTVEKSPANMITASLEMPFSPLANSEFRFDLTYEKSTDEVITRDSLFWYQEDFTGPLDNQTYSEVYRSESQAGGSMFIPGAQITKHWNDSTYSWFRVDFGFGSYDANWMNGRTYTSEINQLITLPPDTNATTTSDFMWEEKAEGDLKRTLMRFYHKTVADFGSNFTFAAGFDFSITKDKADDLSYSETYNNVYTDQIGNVDDASDYTRTYTETYGGMASIETKRTSLVLPVAMEYTLKRWTFRLGAIHTIQKTTQDTSIVIDAYAVSDTTIYGDGTGSGPFFPPDYQLETRTRSLETKSHWSTFYYGVRLHAHKNLELEIIDFLSSGDDVIDADFYRELRLSLTFLF